MPLIRPAIASVVVCLAASSYGYADQGSRRSQGHGRVAVSRADVVRPPVVVPQHVAPRRVVPYDGYYGARYGYRPVYRPGLGFGIYIGSPYVHGVVGYGYPHYARPYPYWYGYYGYAAPYPYAYPYPYAVPYPAYMSLHAAPSTGTSYGGVRLEVTPRDAGVYVDGYYAGIVEDFDGAWERIALEPGPHRFEIAAPGLETLTFDVNVRSNEVVRYRGEMLRAAP